MFGKAVSCQWGGALPGVPHPPMTGWKARGTPGAGRKAKSRVAELVAWDRLSCDKKMPNRALPDLSGARLTGKTAIRAQVFRNCFVGSAASILRGLSPKRYVRTRA